MRQSALRDVCRLGIGVLVCCFLMHTWLVMGLVVPVTVSGSSMEPTLVDQKRLLVDRTAFTFRLPRRWEVVVFHSPEDAKTLCVKRVVGLPGETVAIRDGDVWINGQCIANPHGTQYELRFGDRDRWQLGPTEFSVLGDNTEISDDSRSWIAGPGVDAKLLVGKPAGIR
jgi:signal peptidase I